MLAEVLLLLMLPPPACLQAVARGQPASGVYGGEHLVRLLVKLPELVPVATMGPQVRLGQGSGEVTKMWGFCIGCRPGPMTCTSYIAFS